MKPKKFKSLREHAEWLRHNVPFDKMTEAEKDIRQAHLNEELQGIEEETINAAAEAHTPKEEAAIYAGGIEMMHLKVGADNTLSNSSAATLYPQYKCFDQNPPPKKSRDANLFRLQRIAEAEARKKAPEKQAKVTTFKDLIMPDVTGKNRDFYTIIIEFLLTEKIRLKKTDDEEVPFAIRKGEKIIWNLDKQGYKKYLPAFVNVCIKQRLIRKTVSTPELAKIVCEFLSATKPNDDYFTPSGQIEHDIKKYEIAFLSLPSNF